ncbi:MAG: Rrf2 family transcriptional regulator [Treponema sp.]|nr:Rrf2 family transcriptional regulator [Treponema sp.]
MRITTRGRYSLRASLALARLHHLNAPISINKLSTEEQISPIFLEQIFFKLRKAGIVNSVRGAAGGFQFARSLEKITVKEILEAAGEELDVTECDKNAKICGVTGTKCSCHTVWEDVTRILHDYLSNTTLNMILTKKPAK